MPYHDAWNHSCWMAKKHNPEVWEGVEWQDQVFLEEFLDRIWIFNVHIIGFIIGIAKCWKQEINVKMLWAGNRWLGQRQRAADQRCAAQTAGRKLWSQAAAPAAAEPACQRLPASGPRFGQLLQLAYEVEWGFKASMFLLWKNKWQTAISILSKT